MGVSSLGLLRGLARVAQDPLWPAAARRALAVEHGDERKVAVALVVVEAVSDHEAVGDLETDIAGGKIDLAPLGLGEQRADLERPGVARAQVAHQVLEG